MSTLRLTAFVPKFQAQFYNEHKQRAETKAMKAAARASKHAVWPPVPKGYGPPASHLRKPTPTSEHPLAWINAALRPAWRRFTKKVAESPRQKAEFTHAERTVHAEYVARLNGKRIDATP